VLLFDETSAHLLNNRTKSAKDSNDRFGLKHKERKEKSFFETFIRKHLVD